MFRSVWDRIHPGTDSHCLHRTGSELERYGSTLDHLHKWTHLVPDSRSDPYRIHQVPCKHKAYPYQFRTGSKRIRSRVNAALKFFIDTIFLTPGILSLPRSMMLKVRLNLQKMFRHTNSDNTPPPPPSKICSKSRMCIF